MDLRSTCRKWIDRFSKDRAVIRKNLGLESFLARPDYRNGSAEKMIEKQARHLRRQMDVALDYQWEPRIVEKDEKVVKMRRAK